jgi:XTP/dITP diphosphohydrolase
VRKVLVATTNRGKLAEVEACLRSLPLEVISLEGLGEWPSVMEDGRSFEENALKKAETLAAYSGYLTLADDSGLEVTALDGAPGIYSARYAGEESDDEKNNAKLLEMLKGVPKDRRGARFVCALALCEPKALGGRHWVLCDSCEGHITCRPRGNEGFGYDPVFFHPGLGKTFGEVDRETKARVSHRGKALRKLLALLPFVLDAPAKP